MSRRNIPWRLVDELHALADQLVAGEMPERGATVELGRKVEAVLNERRPKRKSADRAKQARLLARLLSERTGVRVEVSYSPYKGYDGKVTGGVSIGPTARLTSDRMPPRLPTACLHST